MKRYIISIMFLCLTSVAFGQQNIDQLFNSAAKQPNVTRIKLGTFVMACASIFAKTMGVNSVEVIEFDTCSTEVKKHVSDGIKTIKDPLYETVVKMNEKGGQTKVLIRLEKKWIKELVVVSMDNSITLIRIKGKIDPKEWEKVVKNNKYGC